MALGLRSYQTPTDEPHSASSPMREGSQSHGTSAPGGPSHTTGLHRYLHLPCTNPLTHTL